MPAAETRSTPYPFPPEPLQRNGSVVRLPVKPPAAPPAAPPLGENARRVAAERRAATRLLVAKDLLLLAGIGLAAAIGFRGLVKLIELIS